MRRLFLGLALLGLIAFAVGPVAAANIQSQNSYTMTPLVSDTGVGGSTVDSNIVNGWGITASGSSPWWVDNNGTDTTA